MIDITGLSLDQPLEAVQSLINQNNAWSAEQAQKQMDFQKMMSDTAHQREIADLKAAGLNPVLSAQGQGASTPSGAKADGDAQAMSILYDLLSQSIQQNSWSAAGYAAAEAENKLKAADVKAFTKANEKMTYYPELKSNQSTDKYGNVHQGAYSNLPSQKQISGWKKKKEDADHWAVPKGVMEATDLLPSKYRKGVKFAVKHLGLRDFEDAWYGRSAKISPWTTPQYRFAHAAVSLAGQAYRSLRGNSRYARTRHNKGKF